jgi:hypothetical protein
VNPSARLEALFKFAAPIWHKRALEARTQGADLRDLIALVFECDGTVGTCLAPRSMIRARLAELDPQLVHLLDRDSSQSAIAVLAVEPHVWRSRRRQLVVADSAPQRGQA